jgi:hypothetical protein
MEGMKIRAVLAASVCGALCIGTVQAAGERLAVGEFTATRFEKAPMIDGKVSPGEWDRAFTTSGLIAPFDHQLQESETTMSLGFDQERFYFLFRCRRGSHEWKLWKHSRSNDDYNFGEPSVEIWVTPPSLVPETYQNILNTYPAVFDVKNIPSRGYSAQGWKGDWKVAESEDANHYVIEASVPIKDFGFDRIKNGEVWQFLLCRNCLGAKPRSQASWSITQGFSEIPQHPPVHLFDDEMVAQLTGVSTILAGQYAFEVGVVAPCGQAAEAEVELRFHQEVKPAEGDRVERKRVKVAAGERQVTTFSGEASQWTAAGKDGIKRGYFTVKVTKGGGPLFFRQSFPYAITGWKPQTPVKPANAPAAEELAVSAQYGPETSTILVKADILDLPTRERVATAEAKVVDAASGQVLANAPMRPFREWYGGTELRLKGAEIPTDDFRKAADVRAQQRLVRDRNTEHQTKGEPLEKVPEVPKTPGKRVQVTVSLKDKEGKELKNATKGLELVRYAAEWMDNSVGVTDKVIPPWTPVRVEGNEVRVWNRTLSLDGLGLGTKVFNGGADHLAAPMRLVAVKDGKEIEIKAGTPKLQRHVEAGADFNGTVEAAGLRFTGRTHVEFDGFVNINLDIAPAGDEPAKVERLFLEIALPADKATHFCTTAGGWSAVHDVLPDRWTSQATASGMLVGDFVPYIWLTDSERAFLWFADHDRGWNHEPDKARPTQEIRRENGIVYLRVNFFEIPTEVKEPRTITWGWQTFPSRPLPPGWRATFCAPNMPTPHTRNTYFWIDADWAVLWPYYCSPFPWHLDKSKALLSAAGKNLLHRPCVGSIAHSIGRYQDYDGNQFPGLAVDWGATPGQIGNSDVTASKGPNDFRLWHYQRWVREGGFRGLYVDENYLALEENFLTGNAYWRPDGALQRAYNYVGLRDYFKRMKVMFHQNNVPAPNLWQHITSGAAYHAWLGDVFFEGENVEPTDLNYDYMEVLPAGRLRAIGSSVCAGGVMTMMCQSDRHRTQWYAKHNHQFVGWVMAHDVLPEQLPLYPKLVEAGHLWADDVRFLPYWKPSPFTTKQTDCLVSAHLTDGRVLLWVVNKSRKDAEVTVAVDWKAAGLDAQNLVGSNPETSAAVPFGADGFTVSVLQRDFAPVLLAPK